MGKLLIFYFVIICLCFSQYRFEIFPVQKRKEIQVSILYHNDIYQVILPMDSTLEVIPSLYPEIIIDWNYFNPKTTVYNNDYIVIDLKEKSCISINKATIDELVTLPGIKLMTAQKIIDYRIENGLFQHLEDLMNISGIKEAKFKLLKANICL